MIDGYEMVDPGLVSDLDMVRTKARTHRDLATGMPWEYVVCGEGPVVLLLHRMAGGYDIWFQQLLAWQDRFRLVAVTYPPLPRLSSLSEQLLGLLDALGIRRMRVVGSSLGGYVGHFPYLNEPDRYRRALEGFLGGG